MTVLRHEVSRTYIRNLAEVDLPSVVEACHELSAKASDILVQQGIPVEHQKMSFEVDMRYRGQAVNLPVSFSLPDLEKHGFVLLQDS